ncbi:MAG: T9SS type A sorting domain-containing protein [Bacteroidota bacterium]
MNRVTLIFLFFITPWTIHHLFSQVNFTANDIVPEYNAPFGFGINPGGHPGWTDEQLADIAIGSTQRNILGVGANTLRPALTEKFLEAWNYDIRVKAFQSYVQRGADQNVVFIGYPSEAHRSTSQHCSGKRSELFANLYQSIWDGGANGTPYNDNNYYAAYVYEMVSRHKDYIRFYEVWNEPDFPEVGFFVQDRNEPRNWWDNNPHPCDYALNAPIFYYVRMLRITYEVVKTLDPDAYIAVGGLGKAAFLDAILRNTDNPNQGKVNGEYPLTGGAYFDVLSFHSYPHIDGSLQEWNNERKALDYHRHSDAAVDGMLRLRNEFETVLFDRGYNGATYPEKEWIITETNIPRKAMGQKIGSTAAQVNYMFKCIVEAQRVGIRQVHPYKLGDTNNFQAANSEFDLMGMYNNLKDNPPYRAKINKLGIAYKTLSDALIEKVFDADKTEEMNLPEGIRGAAFVDDEGQHTYVIWAITTIDRSEFAKQTIDLSNLLGTSTLEGRRWEYARNQAKIDVDPSQIELTGAPLIIFGDAEVGGGDDVDFPANVFLAFPNPFTDQLTVEARLQDQTAVTIDIVNRFGQLVTNVVDDTLEAGEYQYPINTSNWANGVFYMQVRSGDANSVPIWTQLVKVAN